MGRSFLNPVGAPRQPSRGKTVRARLAAPPLNPDLNEVYCDFPPGVGCPERVDFTSSISGPRTADLGAWASMTRQIGNGRYPPTAEIQISTRPLLNLGGGKPASLPWARA